ncbi:hypothetical protein DFJ63DRAFT_313257 [Scheffersomyces coipomensis]|uniref:uncharacterized protein n=1 Tax=Scheffersomyces coipomensis TaxID=1788519 RepID=UPI00315C9954
MTFYDDNYIYSFFTDYFPQLPYELIIRVLRSLGVIEILQVQCLIKDKGIRSIKFKEFKKEGLSISIPYYLNHISCQERFHDVKERLAFISQSIEANDDNDNNKFPISIDIHKLRSDSALIVRSILKNSNAFDIKVKISDMDICALNQLLELDIVNNVSDLWIEYVTNDQSLEEADIKLDLSIYRNLQKFGLATRRDFNRVRFSSVKFSAWYNTLVSLKLNRVDVGIEFLRFTNLEDLSITVQDGKNIYIRHMPQSLKKLEIVACRDRPKFGRAKCILNSKDNWPPNLQLLDLNEVRVVKEKSNFYDIRNFKLPAKLISLRISGIPFFHILNKLPDTLEEFRWRRTEKSNEIIAENITFPLGIKTLSLAEVNFTMEEGKYVQIPQNLKHLGLSSCRSSYPLNDYNFENSNFTLESLNISKFESPAPFTRLDFCEFSKLTLINFSNCEIYSLDNFIPPSCLEILEIWCNPISSIDEYCVVFNNPTKYPKLIDIQIMYCEINYISPEIELPINLCELTISDNVGKEFYLNSSIRDHESLYVLNISGLSKVRICEDEDDNVQTDTVFVNPKLKLAYLDLQFLIPDEYVIRESYGKIESYLGANVMKNTNIH